MLAVMLQGLWIWLSLGFISSPASCCGPHFLVGPSPEGTPSTIAYTSISMSGSAPGKPPRTVTSNEMMDVKDLNTILMAGSGRALCWKSREFTWGTLESSFMSPLFQIPESLILCKDVNHTIYKYPLSTLALRTAPLVRRSRCSLRLHGPDEKARLEEVMWPAQAYPSVSSGLRAVTLAAKLFHHHTASHPLLIGAPERQSTGRDGGFTWLDVAFLCSCEFALMIIANLTLRQHVDHGNTQATFHNVYLCFLFSKLNDMRWLPFICEIYLPTPPHHPPSSSVNGKKSFRIQLVHKSLKRKVNQAIWVSFQLGNLGGLKAGAGPLG